MVGGTLVASYVFALVTHGTFEKDVILAHVGHPHFAFPVLIMLTDARLSRVREDVEFNTLFTGSFVLI